MKRFVLVGHPVGHSVSPAMHRAAYAALGVDASYDAVDCPDQPAVRRIADALRSGELAGANVTVPWKRLALEVADRADELALRAGAANVWALEAGCLVAHNTDVGALVDRLQALAPAAGRALILGAGGAALAAACACATLGFERVTLTARRFPSDVRKALERLGAELLPWPGGDAAAASDVIVQATSAGMRGAEPGEAVRDAVPWSRVPASAVVIDVVYNPRNTPFLAAAAARGLVREDGLPMLVGQAARAFVLWLGQEPPLDVMQQAAERSLEAA